MNFFKNTKKSERLEDFSPEKLYYYSLLKLLGEKSPKMKDAILKELENQRSSLKLIASENYSSLAVQACMGNLFTDKYAEGFPYHRFYAGCENVDEIEEYAASKAKELFKVDYAFVQPHSGSDANLCAYHAILHKKVELPFLESVGAKSIDALTKEQWNELRTRLNNQRLLALDYYSGGHLTHGYKHNVSGKMFDVYFYGVDKDTYLLNYDTIRAKAHEIKPLILLAGYSAYPRKINFRIMKEIAEEVGAVLMVDMAHFAGLVAGGVFEGDYDPVKWADVVTSTTHKTLRGPRGGIVLCKEEFKDSVDKACPLMMGGPIAPIMAAKAVAFEEALQTSFKEYAFQIVKNTSYLAEGLKKEGLTVVTGGSDNHLLLLDVSSLGLTGRQAESALRESHITLNRNALPFDKNGPWYTSGLRLGTPALTTLGMKEKEMEKIAILIAKVLKNTKPGSDSKRENGLSLSKYTTDEKVKNEVIKEVETLLNEFRLYKELDF